MADKSPMDDWKFAFKCFTELSPDEQKLFLEACAEYQEREGRADVILGSARQREDRACPPHAVVERLDESVALVHLQGSPGYDQALEQFPGLSEQAGQPEQPGGTTTIPERIREMDYLYKEWDNASPKERADFANACARASRQGITIDTRPVCRPDDDPN
ncbi:MAG: hypothetical protein V1848_02775, partial [Candidatus Magasanikbacteria bacterium]